MGERPVAADRRAALARLWQRRVEPHELWHLVDAVAAVGDASLRELLEEWQMPSWRAVLAALQLSADVPVRLLRPRGRGLVEAVVFPLHARLDTAAPTAGERWGPWPPPDNKAVSAQPQRRERPQPPA